jgi:hypothetical protein
MKEVRGELVSKGYLEENRGATQVTAPQLSLLAMVALRIAATLPDNAAVAADALRALALGIEMKKSEHVLEDVASDVRELLSLARNTREKEETAGDVAEEIRAAAVQLTCTVEEQAADIGTIATRLDDDLKRAAQRVEGMMQGGEQGPPTGPRSYAAVMSGKGAMTAEQAGILARGVRMRRQILVDKAADAASDSLSELSELELKEKANLALTIMEAKMEGAAFVGARKLLNGGVVFDCRDEAMATWVKSGAVMAQFVAALGGTCVYRPRRTEMVAEMVPVEARIEDAGMWRVVEKDGGYRDGAIVGARRLKALARRVVGQRVAHLKVEFADADAANHAIDMGSIGKAGTLGCVSRRRR